MSNLRPIFSDPSYINREADKAVIEGITAQFPIENKIWRLTVRDLHVNPKDFNAQDEKHAILSSTSLTYPVKGTLDLIDKATGQVVDTVKDFSLGDSFHITDKHTLVYQGNNYAIANQLQLLPGVYTRSRETGDIESHINTGSGRSFWIDLDPKTGLFKLRLKGTNSANLPLIPLLTSIFGIGPREASKYVPAPIWDVNVKDVAGKEDAVIGKLYAKLVDTRVQNAGASLEDKKAAIRMALESSKLDKNTTHATLGKSFTGVTGEVILRAMKSIVDIHTGEKEEDNRDSLQFKRVQGLPDFLKTFYNKGQVSRKARSKIQFRLERIDPKNPKIRDALSAKPFGKVYPSFITQSSLAYTPSETNPIESLENVGKVTLLGEGGISSERGVPLHARNIDPSNLGVIDPSRTPESSSVGIDQRFTISARRDEDGILHARVIDNQGKPHYLSVPDMMKATIGFPHQKGKKIVQAQVKGKIQEIPASQVQYWLESSSDMYTVTTNMVPFFNSNHPQRLTMAGKAIPQALSLKEREAPLVQTVDSKGKSFVESLAQVISRKSPVHGTVVSKSNDHVTIQAEDGTKHKVDLVKNLPFNMKGFYDDEAPSVNVGDKVKAGQILAGNNYTKDGTLALGKNLNVAYIPYKGYNHEDGIVISESAAKSMDSLHSYKYDYEVTGDTVTSKPNFRRYFPGVFTQDQLDKLDDRGFAKVGAKLHHGDPVFALLEKKELTPEDRIWGRLHKSLVNPYRKAVELWTHDGVGEVVDAFTDGRHIRILIRSVKPLEIGDKLTGLHGNKGIVSLILPDKHMPYNKATGEKMDLLLNPASVTSRINLGQVLETAAAKIARKTGKPYYVSNFSEDNNLTALKAQLKKHGVSDTDTLVDPKTGKELPRVLTGPQYILKLYKTTDQNYSARNTGKYDINKQPTKGGEEGSKSVGYMEFLGLLGSNARHNLREMGTVKSEENTEFWTRFAEGRPLPKPKTTFATEKFINYLTASGVKVHTDNGHITAAPMTDKDILALSRGRVKEPLMLSSKDLEPEKGGLFDKGLTGGAKGNWWSHYSLAEPTVNPLFEVPVQRMLGLTDGEYMSVVSGKLVAEKQKDGSYNLIDSSTHKVIKNIKVK